MADSGWSSSEVSFRMAGSGNWQLLLPDREARQLYASLYSEGIPLGDVGPGPRGTVLSWQAAGIVAVHDRRLVPLGPIMTDADIERLAPWFRDVAGSMCQAIRARLDEYRILAKNICGLGAPEAETDNVLTILACAEALDMWAFRALRREVIGRHPPRGAAGRFFFWGYAFSWGPQRIFGVTTYGRGSRARVSVIRSHGLDRGTLPALLREESALRCLARLCHADGGEPGEDLSAEEAAGIARLRDVGLLRPGEPPRLAVPVFGREDVSEAGRLHAEVASEIVRGFSARIDRLQDLVSECSFARCSWPDTLSMLFHLAYSYAADALVLEGTIPDFPERAGGEWGVWLRLL